jgi:hypothetical protein
MTQRGRRGDSVAAAARQGDPYAATRLLGHYVEHDIEHAIVSVERASEAGDPRRSRAARRRRGMHHHHVDLVAACSRPVRGLFAACSPWPCPTSATTPSRTDPLNEVPTRSWESPTRIAGRYFGGCRRGSTALGRPRRSRRWDRQEGCARQGRAATSSEPWASPIELERPMRRVDIATGGTPLRRRGSPGRAGALPSPGDTIEPGSRSRFRVGAPGASGDRSCTLAVSSIGDGAGQRAGDLQPLERGQSSP